VGGACVNSTSAIAGLDAATRRGSRLSGFVAPGGRAEAAQQLFVRCGAGQDGRLSEGQAGQAGGGASAQHPTGAGAAGAAHAEAARGAKPAVSRAARRLAARSARVGVGCLVGIERAL